MATNENNAAVNDGENSVASNATVPREVECELEKATEECETKKMRREQREESMRWKAKKRSREYNEGRERDSDESTPPKGRGKRPRKEKDENDEREKSEEKETREARESKGRDGSEGKEESKERDEREERGESERDGIQTKPCVATTESRERQIVSKKRT